MRTRSYSIIGILLFVLMLPFAAAAQQKQPGKGSIELRSISEVEIPGKNAAGIIEVKRVETGKAKVVPGSTVVFTTAYRNIDKKPVEKVVITNPVPEHTTYLAGSSEGAGMTIDYSTDGGKSYAPQDKIMVKDARGTRKAGPADYTHIRWTATKPLAPGAKGSVSFKVKIN